MPVWPELVLPLSRDPTALAQAFATIGRRLAASASTQDALTSLAELTVEVVPGARWVSITRGRETRWTTETSTDPVALALDRLQYELGTGPCLDAVTDDAELSSPDLGTDARWEGFSSTAARAHGAWSVLSIRLEMDGDEDLNAGLNIYGNVRNAFDDDSRLLATLIAAHAAIALGVVIGRENTTSMAAALESNRVIGMAMGILMSSLKVTRTQAFDLLRIASQTTNTKIRDVAGTVTETGVLDCRVAPDRERACRV